MKCRYYYIFLIIGLLYFTACNRKSNKIAETEAFPIIVTDTTPNDTDDPAIWYNKENPEKSLILGTDKGDSTGGIFVFDLNGKLDTSLSIYNLNRPNNIDIEYGFKFKDSIIDIAVFTERGRDMIRVFSLPDCQFIDNGGIPVFEDDVLKSPMGIALYRAYNDNIYAFVSRKHGPLDGYIYQYLLQENDSYVVATKVRALGKYSGEKEVEAIAVDDELGFVYYSDEMIGIRQYYADPDSSNRELALFAQTGIAEDHEGISIYKESDGTGYIILSDQQANQFHIYSREGTKDNPFNHKLLRIVNTQTDESDGSDILNIPLNSTFPKGIFVAMSADKTFQYYSIESIVGN